MRQPCPSVRRSREGAEPLLAIGHWGTVNPLKLVDPTWAGTDRARLVKYLTEGWKWQVFLGFSFCRFKCGIPDQQMGSVSLSDGTWGWPEGLAHYVESHAIALPDQFLEHARANEFRVPENASGPRDAYGDETLWEAWADSRGAFTPREILSRERVVAFLERVSNAGHSVRTDGDAFVLPQPEGDVRMEVRIAWEFSRKQGQFWYPAGGAETEAELEQFLSIFLGRPIFGGR